MRNAPHGGLTPPALVLVCGRLPVAKRLLRCTNAHYQERRASARRGLRAAFATATVYRGVITFLAHDGHQASDGEQGKHSGGGDYISRACPILEPRLAYASRSCSDVPMRLHRNARFLPIRLLATGGLRPPLLCWCADVCRWKNAFCDARTHITGSGGRQPAVVSETGFATAIVYRGEGALRRYARLARCTVEDRNRSAAIVSQQERRASARRGVSDVLAQKNEFVVRGERQNQERRALARRGFGWRNCRNASGESGRLPAVCSQTPVQSR
jgi:hypothetical protein